MSGQVYIYFSLILLTLIVTALLAITAWRQPAKPGIKVYALLAAVEAGTALFELLSMFSIRQEMAQFWFNFRFVFNASIPVLFLIFAIRYSGGMHWLGKKVIPFLFIIPLVTQVMIWTNPVWHLWVDYDVLFARTGPFWITYVGTRVPGVWYMAHSFYSLIMMVTGIFVLLLTAWKKRRAALWRSIMLALGALVGLGLTLNSTFNLLPNLKYNIYVPGIGLSALIYGIAILKFDFFKAKETSQDQGNTKGPTRYEMRTLGGLIVILAILLTGIATIAYFSYRSYAENQLSQVKYQLQSIANLKVDGLTDWRRERVGDAKSISQNRVMACCLDQYLHDPNLAMVREDLQTWLDVTREAYDYERVLLMDNEAGILFRSPLDTEISSTHIHDLVEEVITTGEITWRDFHFHEDGHIQLSVLAPIFSNRMGQIYSWELSCSRWIPRIGSTPICSNGPTKAQLQKPLLVRSEERWRAVPHTDPL